MFGVKCPGVYLRWFCFKAWVHHWCVIYVLRGLSCFLVIYGEARCHAAHAKCLALQESVEAQLALINTPVHPTQE